MAKNTRAAKSQVATILSLLLLVVVVCGGLVFVAVSRRPRTFILYYDPLGEQWCRVRIRRVEHPDALRPGEYFIDTRDGKAGYYTTEVEETLGRSPEVRIRQGQQLNVILPLRAGAPGTWELETSPDCLSQLDKETEPVETVMEPSPFQAIQYFYFEGHERGEATLRFQRVDQLPEVLMVRVDVYPAFGVVVPGDGE